MATMMDLPAELIISISSYLTTPELGLMRGYCKKIEQDLFEDFAKEFFTKRQFMIEHDSLTTLVAIANHPTLSTRLSEVLISTHFRDKSSISHVANIEQRFNAMAPDRDVLIATGMARDLLKEAFAKLPNLKSVGLRDFDGSGRIRDGPRARWRSWGWATYGGADIGMEYDASALFALVVDALGSACAKSLKMEVILRHTIGLQPGGFYTSMPSNPVLAGLKTLMLDVGTFNETNAKPFADQLHDEPLRRFLAATPALESLRLNFGLKSGRYGKIAVLDWLAGRAFGGPANPNISPVPSPSFHKLKRLDIGTALIPASTLLAVLTAFDLTSFSLWRVGLQCNSHRSQDDPDGLMAFLTDLSAGLRSSSITSVIIGHINQSNQDGYRERMMHFVPEEIDSEDLPTLPSKRLLREAKYRARFGFSVSQWLEETASRVWDPSVVPASVASASDAEMSDDED